jgi:hypothetical protein
MFVSSLRSKRATKHKGREPNAPLSEAPRSAFQRKRAKPRPIGRDFGGFLWAVENSRFSDKPRSRSYAKLSGLNYFSIVCSLTIDSVRQAPDCNKDYFQGKRSPRFHASNRLLKN